MTAQRQEKVRVYQTQSRLIGLHARCSIIVAQVTGRVSPRFSYHPKPASRRVRQGQPAFKGERARLNVCELCTFRAMPEKEFVAVYRILSHAKTAIQSSEDRALTLGQHEIMEFVRVERVNAKLDEEARKADKDFRRYEMARRQSSPLTPSLAKRAKEIEDAFGPDNRFPPARPAKESKSRPPKPVRAKGQDDLALISEAIMLDAPSRRASDTGNGNLIPERASVSWLKAELKKLLDAERTSGPLSVHEYQFKGALKRALQQRNVEVAQ